MSDIAKAYLRKTGLEEQILSQMFGD